MSKNKKTVILLLIAAVLIAVVPLFVLYPWNVVCRYGIPEKVGLEKWNPHIPEKKDRTAAYRQVGKVHGGNCG